MNCINNYLIIKPDPSDRTTKAGIQMPDIPENEIAIWTGTVIHTDKDTGIDIGAEIVYSKILAQRFVHELEELAVVDYQDIIAVL